MQTRISVPKEQGDFINNPEVQSISSKLKDLAEQHSSSPVGYEIINKLQKHLEAITLNKRIEYILQTEAWKKFHHVCLYLYRMQQTLNYLYKQMDSLIHHCTQDTDKLEPYLPPLSEPLKTLNIPPLFRSNQNNTVTTLIDNPQLVVELVKHFKHLSAQACDEYLNQTIGTLQQGVVQFHSNASVTWNTVKKSGIFGWPGYLLACIGITFIVSAAAAPPLAVLALAVGGLLFGIHCRCIYIHYKNVSNYWVLKQAKTKCAIIQMKINDSLLSVEKELPKEEEFSKGRSVNNSGLFLPINQAKKSANTSLYPSSPPLSYEVSQASQASLR